LAGGVEGKVVEHIAEEGLLLVEGEEGVAEAVERDFSELGYADVAVLMHPP
jgi:hypothetical protein